MSETASFDATLDLEGNTLLEASRATGSPKLASSLTTAIFIQDACLEHRFFRSRETSQIVERPERLRAVKLGLAAAIARIKEVTGDLTTSPTTDTKKHEAAEALPALGLGSAAFTGTTSGTDDLADVLGRLKITPAPDATLSHEGSLPVQIVHSTASVDLLHNAAVKYIHGDVDGDVYLENLRRWINESEEKVAKGESEIPDGMSQGDLYLCPGSLQAVQGALGSVCEAVDSVIRGTQDAGLSNSSNATGSQRAFVAIRPPGHHCGEDTPSGFCFVNNVAVAAAHAHLQHAINRAVIFDIDLHHGNGTQSIAWQINEEAYRKQLEDEYAEGRTRDKPSLRTYYGSIHDVLSYPCEDGNAGLIQAASTSLHGPHGQYIENIHLQPYSSEEYFWDILYKEKYAQLFTKASAFLEATGEGTEDVLVFISCGFDACEHEYPSMSRHGRRVPASFYHRFARDARAFADRHARGRIVSVLEGGYSDRALVSGAMAHLVGLVDAVDAAPGADDRVDEAWWAVDNLIKLEKAGKKRRGGRPSVPGPNAAATDQWIADALVIFASMEKERDGTSTPAAPAAARTGLRDRSALKPSAKYHESASPAASPKGKARGGAVRGRGGRKSVGRDGRDGAKAEPADENSPVRAPASGGGAGTDSSLSDTSAESDLERRAAVAAAVPNAPVKKVPRVVLKLGPKPAE